jgi:hypothetical protein
VHEDDIVHHRRSGFFEERYRFGRVKIFIPGVQNIRFSRDSCLDDHAVVYVANRRGK